MFVFFSPEEFAHRKRALASSTPSASAPPKANFYEEF